MFRNFSDLNRHRWVLKLADYSFTIFWMLAVVFAAVVFVLGIDRILMFWR